MKILLEKEKLLFNAFIDTETVNAKKVAFSEYLNFLNNEGNELVEDLEDSLFLMNDEKNKIDKLYTKSLKNIEEIFFSLEKTIEKVNLKNNKFIQQRKLSLDNFFKKKSFFISPNQLKALYEIIFDITVKIYQSGYYDSITQYFSVSIDNREASIKDIIGFSDAEKYFKSKKEFSEKYSLSVEMSLFRLQDLYKNSLHSLDFKKEKSLFDDIKAIHNHILLKFLERNEGLNFIFYLKDNEIYHYKKGTIKVNKNGTKDYMYISMFKNIIQYMPHGSSSIAISQLEKLIPKSKRVGTNYRVNLMSKNQIQNLFQENGFENIHPELKREILKVTDKYIYFDNKI